MENYEDILLRMKNKYKELTGNDVDDVSDIGIRLKVLASEIYSCQSYSNWLEGQMFLTTSYGFALDNHAKMRGIDRKQGEISTGTLKFKVENPAIESLLIPIGTVCSTNDAVPLFFETTEDGVINVSQTSVTVSAKSQDVGSKYNVLAQKIKTMVTPPDGVETVENVSPFNGGVDNESDEDLRQRVLDSIVNTSTGTNKAYYKKQAEKTTGVFCATVVPKNRGTGTVDVFICGKGRACTYEEVEEVQSRLDEAREVNVDVLVKKSKVYTSDVQISVFIKAGYNTNEVKASCTDNIQTYFDKLEVGQALIISDLYKAIQKTEGIEYFILIEPTQAYQPAVDTKIWLGELNIYIPSE